MAENASWTEVDTSVEETPKLSSLTWEELADIIVRMPVEDQGKPIRFRAFGSHEVLMVRSVDIAYTRTIDLSGEGRHPADILLAPGERYLSD